MARNEPAGEGASSTFVWYYRAEDVFRVFGGVNRVPVCAMILPADLARQRLAGCQALGDYNEDYLVLLALLTTPGIEVVTMDFDLSGFHSVATKLRRHAHGSAYLSNRTVLLSCSPRTTPTILCLATRPRFPEPARRLTGENYERSNAARPCP